MATVVDIQSAPSRTNQLNEEGEARIHRSFRHFWHPVMYAHELKDKPVQTILLDKQLVVARLGTEVCAFADICAHRGTPLSLGTIENCELRCAYHGWQYNNEGKCTFIPQKPELSSRINARLKKYQADEKYGMIWVCLVDKPRFPIPEFPQYDDPDLGIEKVFMPAKLWHCAGPRRIENIVDLGHFPILHDGLLGFRDKPQPPEHRIWEEPPALRMEVIGPVFQMPNNPRYGELQEGSDILPIHREWWIFPPLTVLVLETGPKPGNVFYLFFHPTPVSWNKIHDFSILGRNYLTTKDEMDRLVSTTEEIYAQDVEIVEGQRPHQLPEDLSAELHLKGVDTISVLYRNRLVELAKELDDA